MQLFLHFYVQAVYFRQILANSGIIIVLSITRLSLWNILSRKKPLFLKKKSKKSLYYLSLPYRRHGTGKNFWAEIKALHPHARHWCWATVAGMPNDSQQYGFSDDGEPSGTAGKPMLNYLLGSGLGEITAVVVRYYGGILLGTGGLVKAYGGGVQQALLQVEQQRKVLRQHYRLICEYDQFNTLQHLITEHDIVVLEQQFNEKINLTLAINPSELELFIRQITQRFAGKLSLTEVEERANHS